MSKWVYNHLKFTPSEKMTLLPLIPARPFSPVLGARFNSRSNMYGYFWTFLCLHRTNWIIYSELR